tara:strand:+ start:944 stop:2020 length:1077 start_codon:yes stop_codon:yes gene_type:complete
MSTLKTNTISTNDANNVALSNQLNLKSYTTTQRDALTSVAGDTIYNTTTSKVEYYTGSAWASGLAAVQIQYVIVAGGGSGASTYGGQMYAGGGGAGGYLSSVIGENSGGGLSSHQTIYLAPSTNYPVSIGAGGAAVQSGNSQTGGTRGIQSYFNNIVAIGGGAGQSYIESAAQTKSIVGGSGGGRGNYITRSGNSKEGGEGLQGYNGGESDGNYVNNDTRGAGGGGGAGAVGGDSGGTSGGNGGAGISTSISGSSVSYAGGGGGSGSSSQGSGGAGGGADGEKQGTADSGTANTGGGGGGSGTTSAAAYGGNGGSGIVVLRYPNTYTISQSGLTLSTATTGSDKVTTITAGTGTVSFA